MDAVDQRLRKLDAELLRYKEQLARMPEGASKDAVKRQALQVLQQKKQYEGQRGMMVAHSFNLEQANFAVESMASTAQTVQVMKGAAKDLKKQIRQMNVGRVEDLRDEMEDLMMDTHDINEVLARSYGMPDGLDEGDLEAELGMLQELGGVEEQPSYLADLPSAPPANRSAVGGGADRAAEQLPSK